MLYGDNGEHPASPYEAQWMFGFVLVVLGFLSFIVVNYRSSGDGRQPSIWIATFLSAPIILMGVWNFLGATIKPNWWLTNKVSTNVGISMFVYWAVMFFVVLRLVKKLSIMAGGLSHRPFDFYNLLDKHKV
ncbi:MAG: hypothetical protein AAB624_02520, partial [Patescibacteria group bacterium]